MSYKFSSLLIFGLRIPGSACNDTFVGDST